MTAYEPAEKKPRVRDGLNLLSKTGDDVIT